MEELENWQNNLNEELNEIIAQEEEEGYIDPYCVNCGQKIPENKYIHIPYTDMAVCSEWCYKSYTDTE